MDNSTHPLARDPGAVRLLEHNLLEIEEPLGADSFTLDADEVTFRRRARGAYPLREPNRVEIEEPFGAASFTLDAGAVTFRRRARGASPAATWRGRIGDWLVRDGDAHWRIASDPPTTLEQPVRERT